MPKKNKRRLIVTLDRVIRNSQPRFYKYLKKGKLTFLAHNFFEILGDPPVQDARWAIKKFRSGMTGWEVLLLARADSPEDKAVIWEWLKDEAIKFHGVIMADTENVADKAIVEHKPDLFIDDFMDEPLGQTHGFQLERYEHFREHRIMIEVFRNNWQDIVDRYVFEKGRYGLPKDTK